MFGKNLFLIFVIVTSYCGYEFYLYKECMYCAEDLYKMEDLFYKDKNFEALFGDDDSAQGFITLVGKYLNPNNNNNVMFYSGLCLKNIGYYDSALQYLLPLEQKYIADKIVTYRLLGCIGDIYVQLKKYTDAEIYYNKAINCGYYCDSDKLVYLFKLIRLYEHLDLHKKAYNLIDDFISQHSKTQKYKELVDEKRKLEIEINKVQSNPILENNNINDNRFIPDTDDTIKTDTNDDITHNTDNMQYNSFDNIEQNTNKSI